MSSPMTQNPAPQASRSPGRNSIIALATRVFSRTGDEHAEPPNGSRARRRPLEARVVQAGARALIVTGHARLLRWWRLGEWNRDEEGGVVGGVAG